MKIRMERFKQFVKEICFKKEEHHHHHPHHHNVTQVVITVGKPVIKPVPKPHHFKGANQG